MPWLRIDENAMDHPKIAALTDGAFRLWVSGLAFCQKHLTDGAIPRTVLRGLRGMSRGRVEELTSSGLWDTREDGFFVHDYLQWNESREHVLAVRAHARERLNRLREKKHNPTSKVKRVTSRVTTAGGSAMADTLHRCGEGSDLKDPKILEEPEDQEAKKENLTVRDFLKGFCELYSKHRHGAKYIVKRERDIPLIRPLLRVHGLERLLRLATVLLRVEGDDFLDSSDRGIHILSARINWLDSRLAEAEAEAARRTA